jgi:hypothetical protein
MFSKAWEVGAKTGTGQQEPVFSRGSRPGRQQLEPSIIASMQRGFARECKRQYPKPAFDRRGKKEEFFSLETTGGLGTMGEAVEHISRAYPETDKNRTIDTIKCGDPFVVL